MDPNSVSSCVIRKRNCFCLSHTGFNSQHPCIMSAGAQTVDEGTCFNFHGDSYLQFTPNNFNNNNSIHYSMKFRTAQENEIILYTQGPHGDDEALFIKNGKLRYHLFNTSPSGVEGSFGAYLEADENVATGSWITVHVFRSWPQYDSNMRRTRRKTGLEVDIDGQTYIYVDYFERDGISIHPVIYLGGYRNTLGTTLNNFTGQIKDIFEEKNRHRFENPSLNYGSRVGLDCVGTVAPN
ncbi:unnamed protein product [Candidula unifasciata]|uniref:Laminin G domain-containing protein n=1 Tax=Candidula unifasciata TaxID=100452 RepID=A0A8S3Z0P9_9EUPU|nr:unnamed protein product [Candidula unifasciata]